MELKYFLFFSLDRQQVLLCAVHVRQRCSDLWVDGTGCFWAENVSVSGAWSILSVYPAVNYHCPFEFSSAIQPQGLVHDPSPRERSSCGELFSFSRWQRLITQRADSMKKKQHNIIPLPQPEWVLSLAALCGLPLLPQPGFFSDTEGLHHGDALMWSRPLVRFLCRLLCRTQCLA